MSEDNPMEPPACESGAVPAGSDGSISRSAIRDAIEDLVYFMQDNQLSMVKVQFDGTEIGVDVTHDPPEP